MRVACSVIVLWLGGRWTCFGGSCEFHWGMTPSRTIAFHRRLVALDFGSVGSATSKRSLLGRQSSTVSSRKTRTNCASGNFMARASCESARILSTSRLSLGESCSGGVLTLYLEASSAYRRCRDTSICRLTASCDR
ncbi:hypothetical protein PF005_g21372 [Phytophthora fragariae]|uniref:Secreted protein n=1 Tax=Phytophthora fragariae TaxID=53985 RepID=A0A6A3WND6_9STRA|nr:hypothetical protein PF003_g10525 [Phytophthora fragariae]KAE8927522.1 hypothetical protein PF009_g22312 [Phytophthora fragariae]KAE8985850.1 hypothetical protein PF011_g20224 [Phytophthora fragariae]KAE9084166.1 hypothetical protein PF010_g20946 [Phytophthora fragariae]KAE9084671.1 hypothetical protein PF007_g21427 [Phytophthora fragariae]